MLLFCLLGRDRISELLTFIETEKIGDDDKDFQYCIAEIKRKMEIINQVMRPCIEAVLLSAILNERRLKLSMMISTTSTGSLQQVSFVLATVA